MNVNKNTLTTCIRRGLLLGLAGAAAATTPVFAQDQDEGDAKTLDAVVVTGSRIRRVDAETASPVFVIDKQAIERTGSVTIGEFLQDTPSLAGAGTNPQVNNGGGDGAARVSLRGLGEERTLLLLNGRRMVYDDVNSIPLAMVERVEVLKDGASAIYGSDAIGGVVNFILKKDFEGAELSYNYGISSEDDGQRMGSNFIWGTSSDRGNVIVNINYNDQEEIRASDRDYSNLALTLSSGVVTVGGSSRTTTGFYAIPRTLAAANGINCSGTGATVSVTRDPSRPGTAISDFRCFGNGDLFNYQAVGNLQITPQERAGIFVLGNYNVTDSITAYVEAYTQNTRSASQIAPLPFDGRPGFDNVPISAQNIYNPFGVDLIDHRERLTNIGNRRFDFSTDVKQATAGLKGTFGETSWSWDAAYTWGKVGQESTTTGYLLTSALATALGPSFRDSSGVARCGTPAAPIANCTPVDFIGLLDPSSAAGQAQLQALGLISPNTTNTTSTYFKNVQANFSGDLFELPAGMMGGAIGFEYRKDRQTFAPDFLANIETTNYTCLISSEACTSGISGEVTTKEVYGEAFVPLLSDLALVKSLNATVGVRWSDYDTFGNTTNYKIGLEWRPIEDLLVRSTYAEVFRAPRIADLFSGQFASSDGYTDPCNGYTGGPNPACVNVPRNGEFNQSDSQLSAIKGGNPDLKPEEGDVFTWGVVYDPSWLENFSTTIDIWDVHLDDTIGTIGTQNILNSCFTDGQFCELFSRDANGELIRLFDANANVGVTDTNGVDIGFKYAMDTDWGNFRASLDTTYVAEYNVKVVVNGEVVARQFNAGTFLSSANGGLGNYSRWRGLGNLSWNLGPWEAQWTQRYVHGFSVGTLRPGGVCADAGADVPPGGCQFDRGAITYHNFQFGYTYEPWKAKVQVGIDNAFDKQPPILYQNNTLNGNTDERTFDTVGRFYWVNLAVGF